MNSGARKAVLALLNASKGEWVRTGAIQAEVMATIDEPSEKKAASATNKVLSALEKAGTIVRIHGAARIADVQTGGVE